MSFEWFDWIIVLGIPVITLVLIFIYYKPKEIDLFEAIERKEKDPDSEEEITKVYFKKIEEIGEGDKKVVSKEIKEFTAQRIITGLIGLNAEIIYLVFRFMKPFELILNPYTVGKGVWSMGLTITLLPLFFISVVVAFYVKKKRGTPVIAIHIPIEKDFSKEDINSMTKETIQKLKEGSVPEFFITYLIYSPDENCYKEVSSNPIKTINDDVIKWYFTYPIESYQRGNLYYEDEEESEKAIAVPLEEVKRVYIKKTRERAEVYAKPFQFKGLLILKELLEENDLLRRRNKLTLAKEYQKTMNDYIKLYQLYETEKRDRNLLVKQGISDKLRSIFLKEDTLKNFISAYEVQEKYLADRAVELQVARDKDNKPFLEREEEKKK